MQVALLYTFRYFGVCTMVIVLSADTHNSPRDMQRSSLDIAYEHVNFMWTLDLSRVQLSCSVDFKFYIWTICSYYEFARERKFIRYWIKLNPHENMIHKLQRMAAKDKFFTLRDQRWQIFGVSLL